MVNKSHTVADNYFVVYKPLLDYHCPYIVVAVADIQVIVEYATFQSKSLKMRFAKRRNHRNMVYHLLPKLEQRHGGESSTTVTKKKKV